MVVDAVVGDLFSNLTANRAQHNHGTRQTEQPQLGGLGVVAQDGILILHLPWLPALLGHFVSRLTKTEDKGYRE